MSSPATKAPCTHTAQRCSPCAFRSRAALRRSSRRSSPRWMRTPSGCTATMTTTLTVRSARWALGHARQSRTTSTWTSILPRRAGHLEAWGTPREMMGRHPRRSSTTPLPPAPTWVLRASVGVARQQARVQSTLFRLGWAARTPAIQKHREQPVHLTVTVLLTVRRQQIPPLAPWVTPTSESAARMDSGKFAHNILCRFVVY
mmetsp:Transcript_21241/g.57181  ORF Transcript_21241/g.57181 Transcript_21241/m.57181 type:complete len:202 (-) Transcript_21241:9-614(-)